MEFPSYYKSIKRKYRYKGKNNEVKDKAWSILSDYVRVRDFKKYGVCVSCGKKIQNWQDGQAGHYISMGGHGSFIGFYDLNIHLQCPLCNSFGGMEAGGNYKEELIRRYGQELIDELDKLKHKSVKADKQFFLDKIIEIHEKYEQL